MLHPVRKLLSRAPRKERAADDAVTDPIPDKTPHLVYGDKSLADEDAFVLLIFGDGFTAWSSLTGVQAGNAIFAVALVCELIVCVIFYLVTYFFLTRKLNLE